MDATVIVVNWNTRALLLDCLASVYRNGGPISLDVVVIDNGSSDGSAGAVRERFPGAHLVENGVNLGFARAVNQGIALARTRHLILLNSDAVVVDGALARLVRYLDAHPEAGIAGAQLRNPDGRPQHSFDNFPTLASEVVNKSLLRWLFPAAYPSKRREYTEPHPVESVIGACLAVRRAAVDRIGPLDEDYFVFLEETDWCLRMWRMGYRVMHVPEARVVHVQGASKRAAPGAARVEYLRSLYRFFGKHRPAWQGDVLRVWRVVRTLVGLLGALLVWLATGCGRGRARARLVEKATVVAWHLLLCPDWMGLRPRDLAAPEWNDAGPLPPACHRARTRRGALASTLVATREFHDFVRAGGPPPSALAEGAAAPPGFTVERLKRVRIKELYLVAASGRPPTYRVKVYPCRRIPARLIRAWRGSRARREFEAERLVRSCGIPTATSVAYEEWGSVGGGAGSGLVVLDLPGAEPMDRYLQAPEVARVPKDLRTRRRVLALYGQFARRIHDAGVLQDDFDPNNVLVCPGPDGGPPGLVLVDFERVRVLARIPRARRVWNLAKANRARGLSRTDRLRWLRAYCPEDGREGLRAWARAILAVMPAVRARDRRRAAANCLTENRNYGRWDGEGVRGWFRRRVPGGVPGGPGGPGGPDGLDVAGAAALFDAASAADLGTGRGAMLDLDWSRPGAGEAGALALSVQRFGTCREAIAAWQEGNAALQVGDAVPAPFAVYWSWLGRPWGRGLLVTLRSGGATAPVPRRETVEEPVR